MAAIVLVHGIAQEQYGADVLEAQWLPALASGVREAGHADVADRLWRAGAPGALEARMAYYGSAFLDPEAQGSGAAEVARTDLAEELATAWLAAAAECAAHPQDRAQARRYLDNAALGDEGAQGAGRLLRPAAQALTRLKWFAPFGFGLAARFVNRALGQVTRYLEEPDVREHALGRVLDLIGPETRVVIGHSLGSVVAYEAMHRSAHPATLITLGSPLALQSVIYPRLRPQPPRVPAAVTRWENLADRDDIVASHLDLAPYFPPTDGAAVTPITHAGLDNGAGAHDATHYLAKRSVGRIVAESFIA
ncbi:hypothetical protein [Nocardia arizonensis]|uniref:hypothetical protein n=1 Tax=Nocardia arizonensis TaxID=1141647 RepID=UPI0006D24AF1|nr:hypothetical protein [Nocardia arizonensis]